MIQKYLSASSPRGYSSAFEARRLDSILSRFIPKTYWKWYITAALLDVQQQRI